MASTVQTERLGIAAVDKILTSAGWFFRELPLPDEGVDAQVESATDDGRPSGRLLALQIKSGPSWFSRPTDEGWNYSIKANNLAYWRKYSLPVVIVLYAPAKDEAYWQVIRDDLIVDTGRGGQMITVPSDNRLGSDALADLQALADQDLPAGADRAQAIRSRRALLDVGWMELLESGRRLFVEAQEWIHKTSGRGSLTLVVEEPNGTIRSEHEWPWVFLPGSSYATELPAIFPWADLRVDEATYRNKIVDEFYAEQPWDSEDQQYILVEDFDDWYEREYAGQLKPYREEGGGEVALWRLELRLNDFGREVLEQARQDEEHDALLTYDIVRYQAEQRAGGHYTFGLGDIPGRQFEILNFESDRVSEAVFAAEKLTEDHLLTATDVLRHARDRQPSDALVRAFCQRFAGELEEDEWKLRYDDVIAWLRELGVSE
jgi:hypothetical protein